MKLLKKKNFSKHIVSKKNKKKLIFVGLHQLQHKFMRMGYSRMDIQIMVPETSTLIYSRQSKIFLIIESQNTVRDLKILLQSPSKIFLALFYRKKLKNFMKT